MTDAAEPVDLLAHAHETEVVVVGGGIAGLVAALEFAKIGMPVTLVEQSPELGGTIGSVELDGMPVAIGASCWAARSTTMEALVAELGLTAQVVESRDDRVWIAGLAHGKAAPLPSENVLGIPANPWDEAVRPFIGISGAWRAYLDRLRPPFTIGKQHNLATLVRSRMGAPVLENLVAPLAVGGYGLPPSEVDVVSAAPGLSSALTRTGSLGAAVADLRVDRPAGAAAVSLEGGLPQLVDALRARLVALGVRVLTGTAVVAAAREVGRWRVAFGGDEAGAAVPTAEVLADDAMMSDPGAVPERAESIAADVLVVATPESAARRILAAAVDLPAGAPVIAREVVSMLVDAPELDDAPRGSAVFAVPGSGAADAVAVDSVRWAAVARSAGAGRHVVHVSFGSAVGSPAIGGRSDDDAIELARREASALLGVGIASDAVRGAHRARHEFARPASAIGHADGAVALRAAVDAAPGLSVVGAWVAGSGLAQVVADATAEAERVRHAVLWGDRAVEL